MAFIMTCHICNSIGLKMTLRSLIGYLDLLAISMLIRITLNFSWSANQCDSFIFAPQTKILGSTLAHHRATPPHPSQSVNLLESLFFWWPLLPLRFLTFFFFFNLKYFRNKLTIRINTKILKKLLVWFSTK